MLLSKMRIATAVLVVVSALAAGGTGLAYRTQADEPGQMDDLQRLIDEKKEELRQLVAKQKGSEVIFQDFGTVDDFAFPVSAAGGLQTTTDPAALKEKSTDDKETLEGKEKTIKGRWELASGHGLRWDIGDEKIVALSNGERRESAYKLDITKDPKAIDVVPGEGSPKGELGKTFRGIYELSHDTLIICISPDERPTTFDTEEGGSAHLMVLQREEVLSPQGVLKEKSLPTVPDRSRFRLWDAHFGRFFSLQTPKRLSRSSEKSSKRPSTSSVKSRASSRSGLPIGQFITEEGDL